MFYQLSAKKLVFGFLGLAVFCLGSAGIAKADAITLQGTSAPELRVTIDISSLTAGSITFSVTNVLISGVTSTITGIGFELPGTITGNSPGVCGPGLAQCNNFTLAPTVENTPGNVPQFNAAVLDFAVTTGPNFAGGNPPGINQGATAVFTVTGGVAGLNQTNFLNGAYVRFQSITGTEATSDVAHNSVPPVVTPEPASLVLLGT